MQNGTDPRCADGVVATEESDPDDANRRSGPCVVVITYYPGMPASSIEKTITNRIERWVNQATGTQRISSRSIAGVSIVWVEFRDDVTEQSALTMTGQLALGALPTLAPNTLPPIVLPFSNSPASRAFGYVVVNNRTMSEAHVTDLCANGGAK